MNLLLKSSVILFAVTSMVSSQAADPGTFIQVETETFDKEDFIFPDDLSAAELNVVYLAMSKDRDNGQYQGQVLMEWNTALAEQELFNDQIIAYHFAVIKAPFFIKGVIRNAMRDDMEGTFPLDRSGILFVGDMEEFAESARLPLDNQATLVFVSPDGRILRVFDGEPTEAGIEAVISAAAELTQAASPID
jgi:hypothetical protein